MFIHNEPNDINLKAHVKLQNYLFLTFLLNFGISSLPKLHLIHDLQTLGAFKKIFNYTLERKVQKSFHNRP